MKNIKNLTSGNFPEIIPDKLNYIYILLILTAVVLNFIPQFLGYDINTASNFNYIRQELPPSYENSFWLENINSGTPYYPLTKTIENRVAIKSLLLINQLFDWKIIFIFLSGVGVFLYLKFRRIKSLPSLLGALIYSLSLIIISDIFRDEALSLLAVSHFPWVVLTLKYLKERLNIFALAINTFALVFMFKTLCWEVILLTIIVLIITLIIELTRYSAKHNLTLIFFSLITVIIAVLSISYPLVYLVDLFPKISLSMSYFNFKLLGVTILISGLSLAIPSITQHILKSMESSKIALIKTFKRVLIYTSSFLLIFIWGLLVFSNSIPDSRILIMLSFLIFFCGVTLILLTGFFSKKTYLILLLIAVIAAFALFNYLIITDKEGSQSEKDYRINHQETLNFLKQDDADFRVLNIADNFDNLAFNDHYSSLQSPFPYVLKNYDSVLRNCLLHEVENRVPFNWNLLKMLKTKYLIYSEKLPYQHLKYAFFDMESSNIIYRITDYNPEPWFVKGIESWDKPSLIMHRINDQDFNPDQTAILGNPLPNIAAVSKESSLTQISKKAEELLYQSKSDTTALMVTGEIYYGGNFGWKAFIDDKETTIYQVNHILRGIVVPQGEHIITMRFEPGSFKLFSNINLYTLVGLIILLIIGFIQYLKENYKGEIIYVLRK